MAPPRRRTRELKVQKEEKPAGRLEEDDDESEPEVFEFTFSEEGLTAKQCAEKMAAFTTKDEFLQSIPPDDVLRFVTKALLGRKSQPIKCFDCERVYASSSGLMTHLRKCGSSDGSKKKIEAATYRAHPHMWLKVDRKDQIDVLEQIILEKYSCFSPGCTTKCATAKALITHLEGCIKPIYFSFKDRPDEFRKLDKKTKGAYLREAMNWSGDDGLDCFLCGRNYVHQYGLQYHLDRCQIEKTEQPWKCYRCGFEAKVAQSEEHLQECAQSQEKKFFEEKLGAAMLLLPDQSDDTPGSSKKRRTVGGTPRATARKNGTMLYRYRKSTVNREFNGVVTLKDQKLYEEECLSIFDTWRAESSKTAFCESLLRIEKSQWEKNPLEDTDPFYQVFTRQSVTLLPQKVVGLQEKVPPGVRISAKESEVVRNEDSSATVAFCGAPINSIKMAPGKMENGDDVLCICTFANETTLESESSVVQFWRHRLNNPEETSELELWFLLHLRNRGTVLSMAWLQKHQVSDGNLVGFAAFSTTFGEVLIYRIDNSSVTQDGDGMQVVVAEPHLTLRLPQAQEEGDGELLNATGKQEEEEGEEVDPIKIDESHIPIVKIAWCGQDGGKTLVGLSAVGSIVVWDLEGDLDQPRIKIELDWQSPPSDISFLNREHVVVGFRERLVKVINVYDWEVKLEENTMKTAGTRVHTDPRIFDSFFTFQSEYMAFPYPNASSVAYVKMMDDVGMLVLIPTANTHQLMIWDAAICPSSGTLVSCGIDGRLVASASGRFLNKDHTFFANRNVMQLRKRRVMKESKSMLELLKEVKNEVADPSTSTDNREKKEPLEESLVEHDEVCKKMWLEVMFDQSFEPGRPELACRDQRIESLNCVETNTDAKCPVSFTGGEAGLLFATSVKLTIKELDL